MKIVIILPEKEALNIRDLLVSLVNTDYATPSQTKTLVKIIQQISEPMI